MAEMETGVSFGATPQEPSRTERIVSEGKDKAAEWSGAAKQKAFSRADERKDEVCKSLDRLAQNIDEFGEGLHGPEAKAATVVSGYVRKAKDLLSQRSSDQLASQAIDELKARPGAIIAGCFAMGFLGARLLKS